VGENHQSAPGCIPKRHAFAVHDARYVLDGRSLRTYYRRTSAISASFQNYALLPHTSVGENIAFPLKVRRVPKPEIAARVERARGSWRLSGLCVASAVAAAGPIVSMRATTYPQTQMGVYAHHLFRAIEDETGQATGFRQPGGFAFALDTGS
jgi:hypothetical protein